MFSVRCDDCDLLLDGWFFDGYGMSVKCKDCFVKGAE